MKDMENRSYESHEVQKYIVKVTRTNTYLYIFETKLSQYLIIINRFKSKNNNSNTS